MSTATSAPGPGPLKTFPATATSLVISFPDPDMGDMSGQSLPILRSANKCGAHVCEHARTESGCGMSDSMPCSSQFSDSVAIFMIASLTVSEKCWKAKLVPCYAMHQCRRLLNEEGWVTSHTYGGRGARRLRAKVKVNKQGARMAIQHALGCCLRLRNAAGRSSRTANHSSWRACTWSQACTCTNLGGWDSPPPAVACPSHPSPPCSTPPRKPLHVAHPPTLPPPSAATRQKCSPRPAPQRPPRLSVSAACLQSCRLIPPPPPPPRQHR